MTLRDDLLTQAWTGPQLTLGGKPIVLSPVRYALLEYWHNGLFDQENKAQGPMQAMGELLMTCSATREEIKEIQRLTNEQRRDRVMAFIVDHEDEIADASNGIQQRLDSIKAAMVESERPGKEEPAHVS